MVRRHPVRAVLIVVLTALIGVGVWLWARPPELPTSASPRTVARTFFELSAARRSLAARHFVWRPGRLGAPGGDAYGGVTLLTVDKGRAIRHHGGLPSEYLALADLWELEVTYRTSHDDAIGNPPGEYVRFVMLGRENASSPWRLVGVGTGP